MTIREMARALTILALLLAPACADAAGPPDDAVSTAEFEALTADVADLQETLDEMTGEDADFQRRIDGLAERLSTAVEKLRDSLADVRSGVAGAEDSAAGALARAEAVASELEVLKTRYDFHLRRYHQ